MDIDRLREVEPGSANYRWEMPAFTLDFEFRAPEVGIQRYVAQIAVREDGSVIRDIDIPAFGPSPEKLSFAPLSDALRLVSSEAGKPSARLHAEILYDPDLDSFLWRITNTYQQDQGAAYFTRYDVDAHTGQLLSQTDGIADFWSLASKKTARFRGPFFRA